MISVEKFLKENGDTNYANFSKKLIATKYQIIGVRIPLLRKFAKKLEPEYIELNSNLTHEEILLYGFSAGNFKADEQLEYLQNILPYIDNWCTCDCIVPTLKKLNDETAYKFFINLLQNEKEFYVRVGIIGLMRFFIKTDKINDILEHISNIKNNAYYVQMATAWFYAELATFNYNLAKQAIGNTQDKFICNKAISKARESYRVTKEQKQELLLLKK